MTGATTMAKDFFNSNEFSFLDNKIECHVHC